MKKVILTIGAMIFALALAACGGADNGGAENTIVIGATQVPHAEILEFVREDLRELGVELDIVIFSDFPLVNPALADGQLDANFFQHYPFLERFVESSGRELVEVAKIHIEPMALYSQRVESIDELRDGAEIGVPGDAINRGRAMLLLDALGLITLRDDAGTSAGQEDIIANPRGFIIRELDAAMLPRALEDLDAAIINANFALQAGMHPYQDSIAIEDRETYYYSPYANIVVVRPGYEDNENILKLISVLQTERVREFILDRYDGAVVPAF